MNIFAVDNNSQPYELTRELYIEKTKKLYPFFQSPEKYNTPHFALCPACQNPIQVINLYGAKYKEKTTGRVTMHGRHFKGDVDGLSRYNETNYRGCYLHNPISFGLVENRDDERTNEEILEIVKNNKKKLAQYIREITGILMKNEKVYQIIEDYIAARDYCYTHTNRLNIAYSILYTRESLNLFGQKIDTAGIGKRIGESIETHSHFFKIEDGRIEKDTEQFVLIYMIVSGHKISNGVQYMTISVEERCGEEKNVLFRERIKMKQYIM